jgi:hypothetical protein
MFFGIIVCAHSKNTLSLHSIKIIKDNNKEKGKKIMVTLMILAVVAIMIAQAVNLGHKINLK